MRKSASWCTKRSEELDIAQLVERLAVVQKVASSNLTVQILRSRFFFASPMEAAEDLLTTTLPPELNLHILSYAQWQDDREDWRAILRTVCKLWSVLIPPCKISHRTIVRHWPKLSNQLQIDGRLLYVAAKEGRIDVLETAYRAGHLHSLTCLITISPETVDHHAPIKDWKDRKKSIRWHPLLLRASIKGQDPFDLLAPGSVPSIVMIERLSELGRCQNLETYRHFIVDEAIIHLRRNVLDWFLREDDRFVIDRSVRLLQAICRRILRPKPLDSNSRFQLLPEFICDRFSIQISRLGHSLNIQLQKALLRLAHESVDIRNDLQPCVRPNSWYEVYANAGWCLSHHVSLRENPSRWLEPVLWTTDTCPLFYCCDSLGNDGILLRIGLHLLLGHDEKIPFLRYHEAMVEICRRLTRIEFVLVMLWFGLRVVSFERVGLLHTLMDAISRQSFQLIGWGEILHPRVTVPFHWEGQLWARIIRTVKALKPCERQIHLDTVRAFENWMTQRAIGSQYFPQDPVEFNFHRSEVCTIIRHGTVETFEYMFDRYPNFRVKTVDALDTIVSAPKAMVDAVFARLDLPNRGNLNDAVFLKIKTVLEGSDPDRPECQRFVRSSCAHGFPWEHYFVRLLNAFLGTPGPERCLSIIQGSIVKLPVAKKIKVG